MNDSEDRYRTMIDAIPTMAWSALPDGSVEFANQRWHDYTGLSPEEARGWGWMVAIHADDVETMMSKWQALLASGQPGEIEGRLRRFDGEHRWFLFRAEPMRDDVGNVVRWYGANIDIEERKRAESLLAAEKDGLNPAN
jgi:PAS domain S-box-containing protein